MNTSDMTPFIHGDSDLGMQYKFQFPLLSSLHLELARAQKYRLVALAMPGLVSPDNGGEEAAGSQDTDGVLAVGAHIKGRKYKARDRLVTPKYMHAVAL